MNQYVLKGSNVNQKFPTNTITWLKLMSQFDYISVTFGENIYNCFRQILTKQVIQYLSERNENKQSLYENKQALYENKEFKEKLYEYIWKLINELSEKKILISDIADKMQNYIRVSWKNAKTVHEGGEHMYKCESLSTDELNTLYIELSKIYGLYVEKPQTKIETHDNIIDELEQKLQINYNFYLIKKQTDVTDSLYNESTTN